MPTLMLRLLQPLGCFSGTAPRGFAARHLAFLFVVRRLPRTALCGDGEATILK